MNQVHLYTDGAASGNPGPGGYGVLLEWVGTTHTKEFSQGFRYTTNNRMELLAVIEGLKVLKKAPLQVTVFTDSKYVCDSVEKKWVFNWENKQFKSRKNADLWRFFLVEYRKHDVSVKWIKGHNQHPQNERCDQLAVKSYKEQELLIDQEFENQLKHE